MQENLPDRQHPVNGSDTIFKPGPAGLFVASVAIIFVAEALLMLVIYFLDLPNNFFVGFVDAALLSLFVVPTLYFMFFKPMRETILRLDNSERIQEQLEEIDQLKSDFISIASHEMYTPITAIMGYTEILLDNVNSDQRKEYLEVIHSKTQTLKRIIDDLGIVNRLEAGENLKIISTEHDLLKTVNNVCNVYRFRFPDINIQLDLPEGPLVLLYDEIRISQVLDNLLSNAVKYSNDIHDVIGVSVVNQETQVLIRVRDEGIGMTTDELRQIYDKFFRAQPGESEVGGLGLGMAIVKNIVESHNGTIDIVSQRKVGTTVTVALPK
ncbi:MAG: HAMP domain-containing histidine kinase [Desulfuromonadales bacterium]|nr:HAMP domain-containing histidine kinase [Desulfuromonadales bacterium]